MNNSLNYTNDIIKYTILMGSIYVIIKKIPERTFNNKDLSLILITIIIGVIFVDYIDYILKPTEPFGSLQKCSTICDDSITHPCTTGTPLINTSGLYKDQFKYTNGVQIFETEQLCNAANANASVIPIAPTGAGASASGASAGAGASASGAGAGASASGAGAGASASGAGAGASASGAGAGAGASGATSLGSSSSSVDDRPANLGREIVIDDNSSYKNLITDPCNAECYDSNSGTTPSSCVTECIQSKSLKSLSNSSDAKFNDEYNRRFSPRSKGKVNKRDCLKLCYTKDGDGNLVSNSGCIVNCNKISQDNNKAKLNLLSSKNSQDEKTYDSIDIDDLNDIDPVNNSLSNRNFPDPDVSKSPLNDIDNKLVNYYNSLISDLTEKGMIDSTDTENINIKIESKLLSLNDVITSLEQLKKSGKTKPVNKFADDRKYSELPSDFYSPIGDKIANDWDNNYTILNTNKWKVPVARPPVCINTSPCKVCAANEPSHGIDLGSWNDSRIISNNLLNKSWAAAQTSA
jgi:hypothetical protein